MGTRSLGWSRAARSQARSIRDGILCVGVSGGRSTFQAKLTEHSQEKVEDHPGFEGRAPVTVIRLFEGDLDVIVRWVAVRMLEIGICSFSFYFPAARSLNSLLRNLRFCEQRKDKIGAALYCLVFCKCNKKL